MTNEKLTRAMMVCRGTQDSRVVNALWDAIPEELIDNLLGRQLGMVLNSLEMLYQSMISRSGVELFDTQTWIARTSRSLPLSLLDEIRKEQIDQNHIRWTLDSTWTVESETCQDGMDMEEHGDNLEFKQSRTN
jgi:hypothetical protein